MLRFYNRLREKFNLTIYGSKDSVLRGLKIATLLASLIGVLNLIYYYGFPQSLESKEISLYIIKGVFVIFIISYLTRFLYSFHPLTFLLTTWFEGLLILLLIYDGISLYLFNVPLLENIFNRFGLESFTDFYVLFIQIYMMVIIGLEAAKASRYLTQIDLRPSTTFMLSFLILILTGTGMIMLPEMTTIDGSMPFIDALFTSASASCVTGLMVVDASTYFTFKGHVVILILIQLGGLGIISFAAFFASFLSGGNVGVKHASIIMDYLSPESQYNTKSILRQIILTTLTIEILGAIVMFSLWDPAIEFDGTGDKIFQSIFHSIAAFCNAGISTFHGGLYNEQLRTSYILHLAFMLLMILGGIGFPVLRDLFGINHLRTRLKYPWKQWEVGTKISIYTTGGLVIVCSIFYFFLEQDNTLSGMDTGESIIASVFQTVTRTGGYNTVDISQIGVPSLIMVMFLMFIGGSSASTAGGVKTSTLFIMLLSAYTTIKGNKKLEAFKRNISLELLHKAFTIFGFATLFVLTGIFALSIIEPDIDLVDLAFEEISAFGTTGLSRGITAQLSDSGKVCLLISMFVGRVSTLALFFSLSTPQTSYSHKYPDTNFMIG